MVGETIIHTIGYSRAALCLASAVLIASASAAPVILSLTPNLAGTRALGTPVTWTAAAADSEAGALWYRFRIGPHGGKLTTIKDYSPSNAVTWAENGHEGAFDIEVSVENSITKQASRGCVGASCLQTFQVAPLVWSYAPIITESGNPLVLRYSAPPCPAGASMRVRFRPWLPAYPADAAFQTTPAKPCNGLTMNFLLAGMRSNTTYSAQSEVLLGSDIVQNQPVQFLTGSASSALPVFSAPIAPQAPASVADGVLLQSTVFSSTVLATDLSGNAIWYYPFPAAADNDVEEYVTRPIAGGGVFYVEMHLLEDRTQQFLRAIDLAGNVVLETNAATVSNQLAAMNLPPINGFHHEARYLPNGDILTLGLTEKIFTDGTQGSSPQKPIDVAGDMIVVLDSNLQVAWAWNSFDHLNVNRMATQNDLCQRGTTLCPAIYLANTANDWTHGNCAQLTSDGDIIFSARAQDYIYKIDYRNGSGSGALVWTLGGGGDFFIDSNDPLPWFSHQHDPEFQGASNQVLSLFDNGNTRVSAHGGHSRGQVLAVDEANRTVSLALNVDLGVYSAALGTAQLLSNGDYHFNAGLVTLLEGASALEYDPDGQLVYRLDVSPTPEFGGFNEYRSFRMPNLYTYTP